VHQLVNKDFDTLLKCFTLSRALPICRPLSKSSGSFR